MSVPWAAGGTVGLDMLGTEIERDARAREPTAVTLVWVTAALKALGAALALALARRWGLSLPARMLIPASWAVGLLLVAYAGANLVQHGLMAAGAVETPDGLGSTAVVCHLALWDPFWLLGGALFTAAAWCYGRGSAERHAPVDAA